MKRILPFLIILVVLGVALGSVWYLTKPIATSNGPATPSPVSSASQAQATPSQTPPPVKTGVAGAEPGHTRGPANAVAQLEEFGDYQCPPCGMFHPILEQMEKEFGDKLQVTFRHFPLPNHQHALRAASAAEAAGLQGKFWQMHALIYEHQKDWKDLFDVREVFDGYAKQLSLDVERFNRDLGSSLVQQRILADSKRGQSLGVQGTPSVFLNGRAVAFENLLQAERLRAVIQKEIDSKK